MKKQMIVTAVMSLVVTLTGCGAANGSDNANNGSVTKKTSAADAASAQEETVSQEENKGEDNSEDKKTAEGKSDDKTKEKKSADEKTQGKKAASAEVSAIVGEWREFRGSETRFLNVYSDASFEVKSDTGSIITSGNITTETVDGIVKYSLNDSERGLWYVPFITYSIDGVDHLQTEENSAYEAVVFIRDTGDPGSDPSISSELSPILGTWYDEDNAAGRTITVYDDGTYILTFLDGDSISGYVTVSADNYYYDFCDDYGLWYTFCVIGEGEDQQLYSPESAEAFGRSPSTSTAYDAIDEITGTWLPNDPSMEFTLTVYSDYSYTMDCYNGETFSGIISIEIRDGVEKYSFINDKNGLWLVPFELRAVGQQMVLITEDNPVYEPVSFSRG